ncbi:MAG: Gfo/Idh/MocA family oxidoreductase [Candidatus Latescibacteria bacterium]|jgi:predicted dehydrogenase|nr:Gfo/Idh/MocA family oxidoreductase [Candidatus Latescibacterota bacterium]MBT4140728.1 Gfo/Idh/MocA family oxidoreductase [Candidatus Latescibacterota bacterium]MBT5828712.1 Gfo/Idh/MocA family oxidoreductase [Candidatus Latescibacterota bacterium]
MPTIKWGIIGCGDVCEVKSGPGFYKAENSALTIVMRRDGEKAADFAKRHNVSESTDNADEVINHPNVDAVYIATPPSSHCEYALKVAEAGKPCYVEKPMALNYRECQQMVDAFKAKNVPLYVAYYRRGLPRFLKVRELLQEGAIGQPTSVHIVHYGKLATGEKAKNWRYDPTVAGAGTFLDLASHGLDILDFLISPIKRASGFALNTGKAYDAEDATTGAFEFESGVVGTGVWNFNANYGAEYIVISGTQGEIKTPVFGDTDIILKRNGQEETISAPNPPHVHQPLIQSIVNELNGQGQCASTGESGARASWAMDQCLLTYYGER